MTDHAIKAKARCFKLDEGCKVPRDNSGLRTSQIIPCGALRISTEPRPSSSSTPTASRPKSLITRCNVQILWSLQWCPHPAITVCCCHVLSSCPQVQWFTFGNLSCPCCPLGRGSGVSKVRLRNYLSLTLKLWICETRLRARSDDLLIRQNRTERRPSSGS